MQYQQAAAEDANITSGTFVTVLKPRIAFLWELTLSTLRKRATHVTVGLAGTDRRQRTCAVVSSNDLPHRHRISAIRRLPMAKNAATIGWAVSRITVIPLGVLSIGFRLQNTVYIEWTWKLARY